MGRTRRRRRTICGTEAIQTDVKIWVWTVAGRTFRWCPIGFTEEVCKDGGMVRIVYARTLDAAVGYTTGFVDGLAIGWDRPGRPDRTRKNKGG